MGIITRSISAVVAGIVGKTVTGAIDGAMTELKLSDAQYNHALAEGHEVSRATSEKEEIEDMLRYCRENRYWTPDQHDFMDDFMFHIQDTYEIRPEIFENN